MPRVSILIPAFNRETFIEPCIRSAMRQSFRDLEIVVADNASTDGTLEVCRRLQAEDDRIRVIANDENLGPVRNWLVCAEASRGTLSKILFSDDLLHRNCVERMVQAFDQSPDAAFVYAPVLQGPELSHARPLYSQGAVGPVPVKDILHEYARANAPVSPGAVMLRRADVLLGLRWSIDDPERSDLLQHGAGSDVMLMLDALTRADHAVRLDTPLVFFREHAGSFTLLNSNRTVTNAYREVIGGFLGQHARQSDARLVYARAQLLDMRARLRGVKAANTGDLASIKADRPRIAPWHLARAALVAISLQPYRSRFADYTNDPDWSS